MYGGKGIQSNVGPESETAPLISFVFTPFFSFTYAFPSHSFLLSKLREALFPM